MQPPTQGHGRGRGRGRRLGTGIVHVDDAKKALEATAISDAPSAAAVAPHASQQTPAAARTAPAAEYVQSIIDKLPVKELKQLAREGGLPADNITDESELRALATKAANNLSEDALRMHFRELTKDMMKDEIVGWLNDPTCTPAQRDFARMRKDEAEVWPDAAYTGERKLPHPADQQQPHEKLERHERLQKAVLNWQAAESFERGDATDALAALRSAASALLVDEKRLPVRSLRDPASGNMKLEDVTGAYPLLHLEARRVIKDDTCDPALRADAHVFLGHLSMMVAGHIAREGKKAREHFVAANRLRGGHSRILYCISAMTALSGQTSKALEELLEARKIASDPVEQWSYGHMIGRQLMNLSPPRYDEAAAEFQAHEKYAFQGTLLDGLEIERAHAVESLYYLVSIAGFSGRKEHAKAAPAYFKEAQSREKELTAQARARIDSTVKYTAQAYITSYMAPPNADSSLRPRVSLGSSLRACESNRECHHCGTSAKLQLCGRCNVAAYCSKDCQKAAWKAGHKHDCEALRAKRTEQKTNQEVRDAERSKVLRRPAVDAELDPMQLWKLGVGLSSDGKHDDALWHFLLALFMDFSLDAQDFAPVKLSLAHCSANSMVAVALTPMADASGKKSGTFEPWQHAHQKLQRRWESDKRSLNFVKVAVEPPRSLADVDHDLVAVSCAALFWARTFSRVGGAQSKQGHFEEALKLISVATESMCVERFLTLQFELGYAHRDVGAFTESLKHYEMLLGGAPKHPNAHWKRQLEIARQSVGMLEMAKQLGVSASDIHAKPTEVRTPKPTVASKAKGTRGGSVPSIVDHVLSFSDDLEILKDTLYSLYIPAIGSSTAGGMSHKVAQAKVIKSQAALQRQADSGDVNAQYLWGKLLDDKKVPILVDRGDANYMQLAADAGHAFAMTFLGNKRAIHEGAAQEGMGWWQKAVATAAVPEAVYNLGVCYGLGQGVPVDLKRGAEYYSRAATIDLDKHHVSPREMVNAGSGVPLAQFLLDAMGPSNQEQSVFQSLAQRSLMAVMAELREL